MTASNTQNYDINCEIQIRFPSQIGLSAALGLITILMLQNTISFSYWGENKLNRVLGIEKVSNKF